jgi:hypothetical protein
MSHAHDFQATERGWACESCPETSATCGTCQGASGSSLLICPSCIAEEERVLRGIDEALGYYQPDPRPLVRSARLGGTRISGSRDASMGATSLDDGPDPGDVEDMLLPWVARWVEFTGAENVSATEYLRSRLLWASHQPELSGWTDYREDVRKARFAARRVARLLPVRRPVGCPHCGGTVVQDWADSKWRPNGDGLSDVRRCTGCGMTWGNDEQWAKALTKHVQAAPEVKPGALVTIERAKAIWPDVPGATMRSWLKRDRDAEEHYLGRLAEHEAALARGENSDPPYWVGRRLPERGYDPRTGEPVYLVADLAAMAELRVSVERAGRRAS